MLDFLRFWRFYRYPAQRWSVDIREILKQKSLDGKTIIDAPCGDGVIAYWTIKAGLGRRYELYDLSERSAAVAKRLLSWKKTQPIDLKVDCADIFDVPVDQGTEDVWLFINSLYLLPNVDNLLSRMRPRAQTIIGVFPCITSKSYKSFVARSPNRNINEMGRDETIAFFEKHGYQLLEQREFCYVSLMSVKSRYGRLAASYLVSPIERFFPRKDPAYWLGVFERKD